MKIDEFNGAALSPREVFSFQRNSINFINLISFPFNTFPWAANGRSKLLFFELPIRKSNSTRKESVADGRLH